MTKSSTFHERWLEKAIRDDLSEKMVFVGGPRQVGKTTLSRRIGDASFPAFQYLNYDFPRDRAEIQAARFAADAELIVLDEIHKLRGWKTLVKGIFDKLRDRFHILVTGSARLDVYRRGGDSLAGRYRYYRLHPFSLAELAGRRNHLEPFQEIPFSKPVRTDRQMFEDLQRFGGFPEPLFKANTRTWRRWHNERLERVVRDDIRDLRSIRDISLILQLVDLLPTKVGSLLSINSLREDLQISHHTATEWLETLESLYFSFRIFPFTRTPVKSLKKEGKTYLWDWSGVMGESARFENLVASHLLKLCHALHDRDGHRTDLWFLRDLEGREVDFLVTEGGKPWFVVEVKMSAEKISRHLSFYAERTKIPFLYQVVFEPGIDSWQDGIRIMSADRFLSALY